MKKLSIIDKVHHMQHAWCPTRYKNRLHNNKIEFAIDFDL